MNRLRLPRSSWQLNLGIPWKPDIWEPGRIRTANGGAPGNTQLIQCRRDWIFYHGTEERERATPHYWVEKWAGGIVSKEQLEPWSFATISLFDPLTNHQRGGGQHSAIIDFFWSSGSGLHGEFGVPFQGGGLAGYEQT